MADNNNKLINLGLLARYNDNIKQYIEDQQANITVPTKTSDITNDSGFITASSIPSSLKNPTALTFGSKSYDGSAAQEITAADLGLSGAMKFLGTSTTAISDGSTTKTITVSGSSITVSAGNVVLYGGYEYVWNGTAWEQLGQEGSFKTKQDAVSSPTASGSTTAFIDTISQDANGKITATKKNVSFPVTSVNDKTGAVQITIPTKTSDLTNDSGYATNNELETKYLEIDGGNALGDIAFDLEEDCYFTYNGSEVATKASLSGYATTSSLAKVATSGSYNDLSNKPTIPAAVTVDTALSSTSTNPVQNKVINSALAGKANSSHTHTKSQITDFPTSMPASDVYSWAKASSKPKYTASEVGLGNVDNKSSETIRGELTTKNITDALGYIPLNISGNNAAEGFSVSSDSTITFQGDEKITLKCNGTGVVVEGTLKNASGNSYALAKDIPTGAAADKDIDESISTGSTNLPTSKAVASFVEDKGYQTAAQVKAIKVDNATNADKLGNTVASDYVKSGVNQIGGEFKLQSQGNMQFSVDADSLTLSARDIIVDGALKNVDGDSYITQTNLTNGLNNKQPTITGAATTVTGSNLTASRALISNSSGKIAVSDITSTELGYLDGVTSNIQNQLNSKGTSNLKIGDTATTAAAGNHTHNYAGSSSAGGAATTALACTGNAATATKATQDGNGKNIADTYATKTELGGYLPITGESNADGVYIGHYDSGVHFSGDVYIDKETVATEKWVNNQGFKKTDNNTTYTFATGDANGQIKVTPSSGSAYNVSVKGLGSAAYTASTAYATSSHTHTKSQITDFPTSMPASDVYSWAKAASKPSYTASEVGALGGSEDDGYFETSHYDEICFDADTVTMLDGGTLATQDWVTDSAKAKSAETATKLGTDAGSATQPVYFSGGKPVATTYSLGASVPSGAKFTDTTYSAATQSVAGLMSAADKKKLDGIATGATANTGDITGVTAGAGLGGGGTSGTVTLTNSGVRSITQDSTDGHKLTINTGGSSTTITIPDNNTTYNAATQSAQGLMSAADKKKLDGIATGANAYSHPSTHPASMITGLATVATTGNYHDLSNKPTSLPASDVYSWAKASSKPKYTASEVGALAIDGGNALGDIAFDLEDDCYFTYNGSEVATQAWVGNQGFKKTDNNTTYTLATGDSNGQIKVTPSAGSAYNVSVKGLGSAAYTASTAYATSSHTHTKSQITDFPTSMPASDVYSWAKAASKPSYTASEVGAVPTTRTVNGKALSSNITLTAADVGAGTSNLTIGTTATTAAAGNHTHNYLPLSGGTMTDSIITPKNDNMGIIPHTNNYGQIGSSDKRFYRMYAATFYGNLNGGYDDGEDTYDLIHSGNISSQTVASATKATQDASGKNIADTYATKAALNECVTEVSALREDVELIKEQIACFRGDTQILMADGSTKDIKDVKYGDMIKSYDIENDCLVDVKSYGAYATGFEQFWSVTSFTNGSVLYIARDGHYLYHPLTQKLVMSKNFPIRGKAYSSNGDKPYLVGRKRYNGYNVEKRYELISENGLFFANDILAGHAATSTFHHYKKGHLPLTEEEAATVEEDIQVYIESDMGGLDNPDFLKECGKLLMVVNKREEKIEEFKNRLAKMDYKQVKWAQGKLSELDYKKYLSECETWRACINESEAKLTEEKKKLKEARERFGINDTNRREQFLATHRNQMRRIKERQNNK